MLNLLNINPTLQRLQGKVKMDAALLAEREAFKRRAMAVPTIENKKKKVNEIICEKKNICSSHFVLLKFERESPKKPVPSKPSSSKPPISAEQRKAMGASSQYKVAC